MRKFFLVMLAATVVLCGCEKKSEEKDNMQSDQKTSAEPKPVPGPVIEMAKIETEMGVIMFQFYRDKAPNHVENFKKLAREGFYDGCAFHRVIPNFMIQGGDPNSKDDDRSNDGMGGPGYTIDAEFNELSHTRGIVSMARSGRPDSAGSQFFIMVGNAPDLDGNYTVFGKVIAGMEMVDKIVAVPRDRRDNPLEKVVMKKVSIVEIPEAELKKLGAAVE